MKVTAKRRDGILLIRVSGRIDSSNAAAFDSAVSAALENNDDTVLFDLEKLAYISSAGLRTFPRVARMLRGRSVGLALCAMPDATRRVFNITGFDRVIPTYPTRAKALACLAPKGAPSESKGA